IGALTDSTLVARRIATTQVVACASPAYLREHGAPRTPEELAGRECLLYSYLATAHVWRFTERGGKETAIAIAGPLRTNTGIVLAEAALAGQGILILPAFYVAHLLREGHLTRILADYRLPELGIH